MLLSSSFLPSSLIVQVSLPYSNTDHISVLTNLTLKDMHILLHKIFLFLVNACFAIAILHLISLLHLPSSVITEPKYLNCSTFCSTVQLFSTSPVIIMHIEAN